MTDKRSSPLLEESRGDMGDLVHRFDGHAAALARVA